MAETVDDDEELCNNVLRLYHVNQPNRLPDVIMKSLLQGYSRGTVASECK